MRTIISGRFLSVLIFFLSAVCAATPRIIYVDTNAQGINNGSSWVNAYKYLQDAITDANSGEKPVEIRVAKGIYKPDEGNGITHGDKSATFKLLNAVTIKGGYAGFGEQDPNAQNNKVYETVLSGDLQGNDGPNLVSNMQDNSCHVVTGSYTDTTAVIDGFTITRGKEDHFFSKDGCEGGSGMCIQAGSPTIIN